MDARKSAALRVSPGGFEVSIATYSVRRRLASSGGWARDSRCINTKDTKDTKIQMYVFLLGVDRVLCGDSEVIWPQTLLFHDSSAPDSTRSIARSSRCRRQAGAPARTTARSRD